MSFKMTSTVLLLGQESTEGVDANLDGTHYVEVIEGSIRYSPVVTDRVQHRTYTGGFGSRTSSSGAIRSAISFQVAMRWPDAAAITAGTRLPIIADILEGCGWIWTANAPTDQTFTQDSDFTSTNTIYYFFQDGATGVKHVLLGCRGQANIIANIAGLMLIEVDILGLKGPNTDAVPPVNSTTQGAGPKTVRETNSVFTVHGFEVNGKQYTFSSNAPREFDEGTRQSQIVPTDFVPTSTMNYDVELFATHDPINLSETDAEAPVSVAVGESGGERVTLTMPFTQLEVNDHAEETNIVRYQTTQTHNISVLDDAASIVFDIAP